MGSKAVLITGGVRRLGRELALHLSRGGWAVGIHYHTSASAAEELRREVSALDVQCELFCADLRDTSSLDPLACEFIGRLASGCLLINNAAVFKRDDAARASTQIWEEHFEVNTKAPIFLAQAFAKYCGTSSCVINILDQLVASASTPADLFSYSLSKLTLANAIKPLAQALAPKVRVNAIAPGLLLPTGSQTQEEFEADRKQTPLQRGVTIGEICAAVDFIFNTQAMTGQIITIDGGVHLSPQG
jgi:NAD(P)-dependent dehydrogenase (short-subunit alcohol dehydrogenase family)